MVMLFQELVASRGLYVLLPLDKIKVFAPNLNSGKSNELRKFVYQSCFFQSLFPLIVHFFSQLFQRLPQLCLCCGFSCSNLYSTIINNWSLLPPTPTEYVYIAKEKISYNVTNFSNPVYYLKVDFHVVGFKTSFFERLHC